MSVLFLSATLVAAGTPQSIAKATAPSLPTISMGGITYPAGSATQQGFQIMVQANPANTGANIYIGGRAMSKTTLAGVGIVLPKTGAPVSLGQYGGSITLDDIFFDGDTTGDVLLVSLVG